MKHDTSQPPDRCLETTISAPISLLGYGSSLTATVFVAAVQVGSIVTVNAALAVVGSDLKAFRWVMRDFLGDIEESQPEKTYVGFGQWDEPDGNRRAVGRTVLEAMLREEYPSTVTSTPERATKVLRTTGKMRFVVAEALGLLAADLETAARRNGGPSRN